MRVTRLSNLKRETLLDSKLGYFFKELLDIFAKRQVEVSEGNRRTIKIRGIFGAYKKGT